VGHIRFKLHILELLIMSLLHMHSDRFIFVIVDLGAVKPLKHYHQEQHRRTALMHAFHDNVRSQPNLIR
jgi:hypothetical protein